MKKHFRKILIVVSFVCMAFFERSEPYEAGLYVTDDEYAWYDFVFGRYGDDGRSPNTPMYIEDFKDLDLTTVLDYALAPGMEKKVFFEAGEVYEFGEYDITNPGVKFSSFGGAEDRAVFRGSSDISTLTWTDEGGGVYSTPMAEEPNWVWIGGECAKMAETPRIAIASRGSTTTITIAAGALAAYSNVVGSRLVAKDKKFRLSKEVGVTNFASNILTVDGAIDVSSNIDFALYKKFEFLTGNNEWAWEAGELRVKAAASPSTMDIRVSSYDYCFKDSGSTEFDGLEFKEYYQFGITSENGVSNIHDCYFHDIRDTGVLIKYQVTGVHVNDNTFERIGNNAIMSRPCITSTYNGNTITDVGMQENYGWQTWTSGPAPGFVTTTQSVGCAITYQIDNDDDQVDGSGCEFNDNTISNVAYVPIHVVTGTANYILRNTISNFMNRFEDGGGVYTFHYRATNVFQEDTEIAHNIVFDGNDPFSAGATIGIYADNRTLAAYIHDNTVYDITGYGLLLNSDTKDHIVEDNKFINCSIAQVFYQDGFTAPSEIYTIMEGVTFNRNIMYCGNTTQRCMYITTDEVGSYDPYGNGGASDNNYYINRFTNQIVNSNIGSNRTLAQLQSDYSQDANSVYRDGYVGLITNTTESAITGDINEYSLLLASASSQYVSFGTNADIQFERTDPFSIYFEIKRNGNPATAEVIASSLGENNRGIQIAMSTTGQIQLELRNTATTNRYQIVSPTGYADNKIHKVLLVKKATFGNSEIYIDGTIVTPSEFDNLSATIINNESFVIGARETIGAYFNGYLDRITIWDSDQTANLDDIFNNGLSHDLTGLHYWKIQTGANDAARYADTGTSANKLNGTSSGGPTPTNIAVDVDLTPITTYNIPAHESLLYLLQ